MLEPETFLPLDYIQAKPLKERLRNINIRGVKLLYDVIKYDIPDIKPAVLFVTNNALVCETPEDAMKVAYEMEDGQRYWKYILFYNCTLIIQTPNGSCRYIVFAPHFSNLDYLYYLIKTDSF